MGPLRASRDPCCSCRVRGKDRGIEVPDRDVPRPVPWGEWQGGQWEEIRGSRGSLPTGL